MLEDHNVEGAAVAVTQGSMEQGTDVLTNSRSGDSSTVRRALVEDRTPKIETASSEASAARVPGASRGKWWWWLAAASALLLTALTAAGVYLVTKKPSTIDQLVILTVPSGAEIKLDSKDYGHSPVKIEQLKIGTYTLMISKEGFESIEQSLPVTESGPVEFKLKPVPPSESMDLPAEDRIKQYQQQAEEAFAEGNYGLDYQSSARRFADLILSLDPNNGFALEMRERVRKAAHQSALVSISRGDLAQAQDIYGFLSMFYPDDEETKAAVARLESQLSARRGKVGEWVRKAEEALRAGHLAEPLGGSAYYYARQALAIDHQNDRARQISNQVKDKLAEAGEQAYSRGEIDSAIKQLEDITRLFSEDKQIRSRLREMQASRAADAVKTTDASARRIRGLGEYNHGNYADAIPDLEYAVMNDRGTTDVVFALARSCMLVGRLKEAESYFSQVPRNAQDAYPSSIAALGDIAYQRGDTTNAVERYKQARQLGGSALYTIPALDDKIESIERKQREKAAEPIPLTIRAKHLHGGILGGSCSGTITINEKGVRYDGEHPYSYSISGIEVRVAKDEMTIRFQNNSQKFKIAPEEAERFQETLSRYKQTYSPSKR